MKTQISYRKLDGSDGVALVNGGISETHQAKQELANWLDLPAADAATGIRRTLTAACDAAESSRDRSSSITSVSSKRKTPIRRNRGFCLWVSDTLQRWRSYAGRCLTPAETLPQTDDRLRRVSDTLSVSDTR